MTTHPTTLLVIDDEESICFAFKRFFEARGSQVTTAATAAAGLRKFTAIRPDVVFLDVRLPDGDGIDVLERLLAESADACVIIMTAYGSLDTVTRAIRGKAYDYLVKPLDLDRAAELVEQVRASAAVTVADAGAAPADTGEQMIGRSPAMQEVYKQIVRTADASVPVLIHGETGTGKEVVARTIHEHCRPRRRKAFVAVNCGALPENLVESELFGYVRGAFTGADADKPGRFESADGGTLFLDEIGELPPSAQVKLLRFLDSHTIERLGSVQSRRVDVRILAATNRDLREEIEAGRFREDLFYRLAVVQIELPPLRHRVADIVPLANYFIARHAAQTPPPPLSDSAREALERYRWPGNVRELENAVRQAVIAANGRAILAAHLPEAVNAPAASIGGDPDRHLEAFLDALAPKPGQRHSTAVTRLESLLIRQALAETGGNQSAAAELLGLHRNTLRSKLRELGLDADSDQ